MQVTRCFDIGGTKIVAADVSVNGDIVERSRQPTPTQSYDDFVHALLTECPNNDQPIGISIAGVIEPATGVINCANIPCLSGNNLVKRYHSP